MKNRKTKIYKQGNSVKNESTWIVIGKVVSYIFLAFIGVGIIFTFINGIYYNHLFDKEGVIIEAKITNGYWKSAGYKDYYGLYVREYEYTFKTITYKGEQRMSIKQGEKYKIGECVQVIISRSKPKISRVYSEQSYPCHIE